MGGMISVIIYTNLRDAMWEKPWLVLFFNNILNASL